MAAYMDNYNRWLTSEHLSDAERAEMGARGRELAAERFSWQGVERRISAAMQVALAGAGMV